MKRLLSTLTIIVVGALLLSGCNPLDKKNKAGLQVITNDVPSSVYLDDQYVDKTPFINKDLKPGNYTLKIQPDDAKLASYETSIELRKGLLSVVTWKPGARPELSGGVTYELEKLPNKKGAEVAIVSVPDGAIVSIDGGEKQFAPLIIDTITPDTHEIEASLPSYETQKHTFNVVEGHRLHISIKLAKNPVESPQPTPIPTDAEPASTSSGTTLNSLLGTPKATPKATPKSTPRPTPQSSASASPSARTSLASSSAAVATGKQVKIKPTGFNQNGQEGVRVREASNSTSKEIGFALTGKTYAYLGTENGWHQITLDAQKKGWISAQYGEIIE